MSPLLGCGFLGARQFGKSSADARKWVERSDEANAELVNVTRHAADVVIQL